MKAGARGVTRARARLELVDAQLVREKVKLAEHNAQVVKGNVRRHGSAPRCETLNAREQHGDGVERARA